MPDLNKYKERLHDLFQLEFFGMKLGLENIRALLEVLGNPERKFESIHIAGTNGKGSVAATLAAISQSDGRRTGLYTSPHLIDFRERIRIDGVMISEEEVATFLERIWPRVEDLKATFFEVTTAMAFDHFARHEVDIAVVETGLGGRLDATNVIEPLASVITSIGFDHMAQLGPTLESIASEKAGIIRPRVPAIVNCDDNVRHVFVEAAEKLGAPLFFVRDRRVPSEWAQITPSLEGEHQRDNLKTVLATLSQLADRPNDRAIESGVQSVEKLTGLGARLQHVHTRELDQRGVTLVIDVAHNLPAFERLRDHFAHINQRPIVIAGLMMDKEIDAILGCIFEFASEFVAVSAGTSRAMPSEALHPAAMRQGLRSVNGGDVVQGCSMALAKAEPGRTVLITGSHYVVGEFLQNFRQAKVVNPT